MKTVSMKTLAIAALLLTFAAAETFGQGGSVRGYIRDEQGGVMPGVTVTGTSATVPLPHTVVTGQDGNYRLLDLPPGEYTISAELAGFAPFRRENILVRVGLNLPLDIVLTLGTLEETVTVTGETPMIETKKSSVAVNVSGELQRSVPLEARRHWSEFMRFTPGVVSRDSTNNIAPVFYIRGAGIVSYSTLVDGAEITSAVNPWWGYANMAVSSIEDVQIQTGGMDASQQLGMGAAANVVMKSGTNDFHGAAIFAWTPKSWIGNNTPDATSQTISVTQPEFSLGGPLVKDKLWFFGSYRRWQGTTGVSRTPEQIADAAAIDPSAEALGDTGNHANIVFMKLTGQLNPNHQVSGFFNRDLTTYERAGPVAITRSADTLIGGNAFSTRLSSVWSDSVTSKVAFSWNDKTFKATHQFTGEPASSIFQNAFLQSGRLTGETELANYYGGASGTGATTGGASFAPATKWTLTGNVTKYVSGFAGSHEFQVGVFLQPKMTRLPTVDYLNGGFSIENAVLLDPNNTAGGTIPFHRRFYDTAGGVTGDLKFSDNAFYVQDAWSPTPRLTLNLGLRVDHISRSDELFGVDLQSSFEIGPRVGVNYMLTEDARNGVRASFMRLHDAANINSLSAGTATFGWRDEYDLDLDGNFEALFITPGTSKVGTNRIVDPDYHQPFVDEWAVGFRHQFPGQASVDIGFIHRDYRDRTALVETNAIYEGNVFQGYRDETQNNIDLLTPNRWNHPVWNAFEIIGTKKTDRIEILGNYTRAWSHLAGTWQPRDPASFIQPDAFEINRGLRNNDNRSPSANNAYCIRRCSSHEWMEHIARVAVVYYAPWDVLVSTSYSLQFGRYTGVVLDRIDEPDPQFGPPTVTLSNGRTVSNPLATTNRFAFPTRGEGQPRLGAEHYWNMRFGRRFRFGDDMFFEVDIDILNIINNDSFQGWQNGANLVYNTKNFGEGSTVQMPRTFQLGLQFIF